MFLQKPLILATGSVLFIAGCSTPIFDLATPVPPFTAPAFYGRLVSVEMRRPGRVGTTGNTNPDALLVAWREAAETMIRDSRVFNGEGQTEYRFIIEPQTVDSSGVFSTKARIVARYTIVAGQSSNPAYDKTIESTGEASDFSGEARYYKAFRTSAHQNLILAIDAIKSANTK